MTSAQVTNLEQCLDDHRHGRVVARGTPDLLTIESTAICNLRCVMCPQSIGAVKRPKHMNEDLGGKLAPFMAGAGAIQLHGIGEPLTSPAFWRLLDRLPAGPIGDVNSNFTVLDETRIGRLVSSRLDTIHVSLDAARARTYRRIRNFDFDTVLANIRAFIACRNGAGRRTPRVLINMTLMHANIGEVVEFVELAHSLGVDGVEMWQLNVLGPSEAGKYHHERDGWVFRYEDQVLSRHGSLSDTWLARAMARAQVLGMALTLPAPDREVFHDAAPAQAAPTPARRRTTRDCRNPWRWLMVTSNGAARPCCYAPGNVGNLERESAAEIWNGAPMQRLRRDLLADKVPSACRGAACDYVKNSSQSWPAGVAHNLSQWLGAQLWHRAPRWYRRLRDIKRRLVS